MTCSSLPGKALLNAAELSRKYDVAAVTIRKWLREAGVVPEATYAYAGGVSRLYDPIVAGKAIQDRLPPVPVPLPNFEPTAVPKAAVDLDQLEEKVDELKLEIAALRKQNCTMFTQFERMQKELMDKMTNYAEQQGCVV